LKNHHSIKYIEENYLIFLIVLLGAILRIYNLSGESVWLDEAVTSQVSELGIWELVQWMINENDNNPPLYYMLMHFWVSVFGDSEFSLRLPSVIIGTGSVLMIYLMGKLVFNRTTALIAALILAVSVFHIEYSQEARSYSLLAFLTLCSFYFFFRTLSGSKALYAVAYVLSSVLLMYSHFYGVFILVAQNIFCLTRYFLNRDVFKLSLGKWIGLQVITGLLFVPGLLIWYKNTVAIQSGFWLSEPGAIDIAIYFYHFTGRDYILFFLFFVLALFSFINFRAIGNSKYIRDILDIKNDPSRNSFLSNVNAMYLLLLWLFVPILIPFLISLVSTPVLHTRYLIGSSLALYLLVAKGICNLHSKRLTVLIPAVILILSIWPLRMYYVDAHKYQWRETVAYLESNAEDNDSVFVYPAYDVRTPAYYKEREDLHFVPLTSESAGELPDRFWVVIGLFAKTDGQAIKRDILGEYDLQPVKSFSRLNLYLYEKEKD
jgi:mannosyltransferase